MCRKGLLGKSNFLMDMVVDHKTIHATTPNNMSVVLVERLVHLVPSISLKVLHCKILVMECHLYDMSKWEQAVAFVIDYRIKVVFFMPG